MGSTFENICKYIGGDFLGVDTGREYLASCVIRGKVFPEKIIDSLFCLSWNVRGSEDERTTVITSFLGEEKVDKDVSIVVTSGRFGGKSVTIVAESKEPIDGMMCDYDEMEGEYNCRMVMSYPPGTSCPPEIPKIVSGLLNG